MSAQSYHEQLITSWNSQPDVLTGAKDPKVFLTQCPTVYERNAVLTDRLLSEEPVSDTEAFSQYFARIQENDQEYWHFLLELNEQKRRRCPEAFKALPERRLQVIVPAYREGENSERFFGGLKQQFQETPGNWGITVVINHEIPYKHSFEVSEAKAIEAGIEKFLDDNPSLHSRIDFVSYATRHSDTNPILPNSMARKVGEDLMMLEKLRSEASNQSPLYLGQMDMDGDFLLPTGMMRQALTQLPTSFSEKPVILRAKGSIEKEAIKTNPQMLVFQMVWEEGISAIGRLAKHNPFALGRFGIFPAREYALTGGGLARQLRFIDEDIRRNIQIAWTFPCQTIEIDGIYATSARREIHFMNALNDIVRRNGGKFTLEVLETAAMIRMYNNKDWATHDYRQNLGNDTSLSPSGPEKISPQLVEAMANAWCRFTLFSIFALDKLSSHPDAIEISHLRNKFLRGECAYLDIQLATNEFLRDLFLHDSARLERLKPALTEADEQARIAIRQMLDKYQVKFLEDKSERRFGVTEAQLATLHNVGEDNLGIYSPFKIISTF